MKEYRFSNESIKEVCEETGKFLSSADVEGREALRIKLTLEEVLLNYQEKLGEDAGFRVRFVKWMSIVKVELIVPGESYDVFDAEGEENEITQGLLAGIGLGPIWSYKKGRNHIIFIPKKKPLSSTVKMVAAIGLAVVVGTVLNILPNEITMGVNTYFLTPVSNAFIGLISAVSGPLVFLSVLGSICSMGNMETLGKIGSKTIQIICLHMTIIGAFMTLIGSQFYQVEWSGGGSASFSQVLDLIYGIVPSNLFEPFLTGNTLQLIFIAIMTGLAMLGLSSRVSGVIGLVEQCGAVVQSIMAVLSSALPILIFTLFAGMISNGNFNAILDSWKSVVIIILLMILYYIVNLFRIAIVKKIAPVLLWKKTMSTFMISLTTASSAASFTTNVKDANERLGIDKKLVEFAIPLGQVLFMPAYIAMLFGVEIGLAEACHIPITVSWLVIGFVTNLLVAFAVPPIPGGAVMGFTVVFSQLGIPLEMMGIAIAICALPDFPATAVQVSSWQLTLIEVADSLGMLDKETLYDKN